MSTTQVGYISDTDFSNRSTARAAVVWGLAAIFYFYELMLLVSPSVMLDDLTFTFKTSAEQLGSLAAFYYYAYASMQIPVGLLMDRFGPRILLTFASACCALGCVVFSFAPTLVIAQVGRFVMGIGGAFAVVGCLKLASLWFPVNRFALLTGIMVAVGMMGGVFGQAPVAKLVMSVGWRETLLWGAGLGTILSLVIWFVVTDHPNKVPPAVSKHHQSPFSQEILVWLKFAVLIVAIFFPLIVVPAVRDLAGQENVILYGAFYLGWLLCIALYRRTQTLSIYRVPLACVGLALGCYLLQQKGIDAYKLGFIALSLGFFARLLFAHHYPIPSGLGEVMKVPQVWIASIYAGLMFVPTTGFGQLWGVPYFMERFQIEKDAAGVMVSMIFFGWAIGGPLYGWISDKIGRRRLPMAFAALATLLVMTAILYAPVSATGMKGLMFLLGVFSSGFILAFSIVREINAPLLTGTAIGFINTLNNASGALAQPIIGKLLDDKWDGRLLPDGNPVYTLQMYNDALLFLPVCIMIALVLMPFIRETFCRPLTTRLDATPPPKA